MSGLIDTEATVEKQLEPFQSVIQDVQGEIARDLDLENHEFMPWPGRILVRKFPKETKSKGGLEIHGSATAEKNWGCVISLPNNHKSMYECAGAGGLGQVELGTVVVWLEGAGVPLDNLGDGLILLDYRNDFDHDLLGFFVKKDLQSSDD